MNTSGQDPDIVGSEHAGTAPDSSYETSGAGTIHMAMYAMQFAARRRTEAPRDDLTSLILAGNFGDGPMSDLEFGIFFVQLVTAGNDTTKTMLSAGLLALLEHPEQLAEVRADPSLLPGAVEEILRYENPLHYFRRTATADAVLHDTEIAEGDKVLMYYTSANRDETVFDRPAPRSTSTARRTRTSRSASASTSASAPTWPGSRARCSSRRCSRRSRPSSSSASRCACAPTSTTGTSACRCGCRRSACARSEPVARHIGGTARWVERASP